MPAVVRIGLQVRGVVMEERDGGGCGGARWERGGVGGFEAGWVRRDRELFIGLVVHTRLLCLDWGNRLTHGGGKSKCVVCRDMFLY